MGRLAHLKELLLLAQRPGGLGEALTVGVPDPLHHNAGQCKVVRLLNVLDQVRGELAELHLERGVHRTLPRHRVRSLVLQKSGQGSVEAVNDFQGGANDKNYASHPGASQLVALRRSDPTLQIP
mgnify:CR=1 FL=1